MRYAKVDGAGVVTDVIVSDQVVPGYEVVNDAVGIGFRKVSGIFLSPADAPVAEVVPESVSRVQLSLQLLALGVPNGLDNADIQATINALPEEDQIRFRGATRFERSNPQLIALAALPPINITDSQVLDAAFIAASKIT
ncbi:MAG: hypothetical protein AAGE80_05340 [Pseudomonadota bacterium]